jgi:hypothetical protein
LESKVKRVRIEDIEKKYKERAELEKIYDN